MTAAEVATAPVLEGHPRRWYALGVLCLALGMVAIDNTILNVAIPSIAEQLSAGESELQWITSAYGLALAGLLLPLAVVGDRRGRKGLLLAGLTLFGAASLGAAQADTSTQLVMWRGLMGVGGACTMPATLALIGTLFAPHERGRALAIWSATAGLASAAGPVVGGVLLSRFRWNAVFLVNVPLAIAAVVAALVLVPKSTDRDAPRLDRRSSLAWWAALTAVLIAIIEGPVLGWVSPIVVGSAVAASVLLLGFVHNERRSPGPLVGPEAARDPRMRAGAAAMATMFYALFGSQFIVTQWLQGPQHRSAIVAGVCFLPSALASAGCALLNPRLARRAGHTRTAGLGLGVLAGGAVGATIAVASGWRPGMLLAVSMIGGGVGLASPSGSELIMSSVPAERAGSAAGVNETVVEAAGALGIAVLGSILSSSGSFAWPLPVAALVAAGVGVGLLRVR